MKNIYGIEFHTGSREERLPDFVSDFPYIATRVELGKYTESFVPWHWHKTVELFYVESGILEYCTPKGKILFPTGSGGMVNSNVLHMTKVQTEKTKTVQLIHIFDTSFIPASNEPGSHACMDIWRVPRGSNTPLLCSATSLIPRCLQRGL